MTLLDYYSGSDPTGRIAEALQVVIDRMDRNAEAASDIEKLTALLKTEGNPNWQAFTLAILGLIHAKSGNPLSAKSFLEQALCRFEHHLASFDDVADVYCQACYRLGFLCWEEREWEKASACLLRCVPHMYRVYSDDEVFIANILALLSVSFNQLERFDEALAFAEGAAYLTKRDCGALEDLMTECVNTGECGKAKRVYEALADRCHNWEYFARATEFARRNHLIGD